MRQPFIRLITAAIFLMAQVAGAAVSAPPCSQQEAPAPCKLGCCSGPDCDCDMAPIKSPAKPVPVAPVQDHQEIKFTPLEVTVIKPSIAPLESQVQRTSLAPDAFLSHCLPAFVRHCAFLI